MMLRTNQAGVEIIKGYEGLFLRPYLCPAGYLTVGWGHRVEHKLPISMEQAEIYLKEDINIAEKGVSNLVKASVSENQFSALVSFVFNLGAGRLSTSTLLRLLNENDYESASEQFDKWVFSGGKKLSGLVKRRKAERELFDS